VVLLAVVARLVAAAVVHLVMAVVVQLVVAVTLLQLLLTVMLAVAVVALSTKLFKLAFGFQTKFNSKFLTPLLCNVKSHRLTLTT